MGGHAVSPLQTGDSCLLRGFVSNYKFNLPTSYCEGSNCFLKKMYEQKFLFGALLWRDRIFSFLFREIPSVRGPFFEGKILGGGILFGLIIWGGGFFHFFPGGDSLYSWRGERLKEGGTFRGGDLFVIIFGRGGMSFMDGAFWGRQRRSIFCFDSFGQGLGLFFQGGRWTFFFVNFGSGGFRSGYGREEKSSPPKFAIVSIAIGNIIDISWYYRGELRGISVLLEIVLQTRNTLNVIVPPVDCDRDC